MSENKKEIWVLLTQHDDNFSRLLRWLSKAEYTHASLAIEENPEHFYTFNKAAGFYIEKPRKIFTERKRIRKCCLYRLEAAEDVYQRLCFLLEDFQKNAADYQYSLLGVITCFLQVPWKRQKRYFCSQFVAEVLKDSGAVAFEKDVSLYLPNDFMNLQQLDLYYCGVMGNLQFQY